MGGILRFLVGIAIVGLSATAAQADVITQFQTFSQATPNFNRALTFNKYNGLQADLISVQVELGLNIAGGYLTVDNDGALPATATVKLGASGAISSGDVNLLDSAFQPVVAPVSILTGNTFHLAAENGDGPMNVDPTSPDGATHIGGMGSNSGSGFINPLFFAGYVGAGTFNIDAAVTQLLDFGGIGGVEGSYGPASAGGYACITYNSIPEPATAVLLGLGIIAVARRRR